MIIALCSFTFNGSADQFAPLHKKGSSYSWELTLVNYNVTNGSIYKIELFEVGGIIAVSIIKELAYITYSSNLDYFEIRVNRTQLNPSHSNILGIELNGWYDEKTDSNITVHGDFANLLPLIYPIEIEYKGENLSLSQYLEPYAISENGDIIVFEYYKLTASVNIETGIIQTAIYNFKMSEDMFFEISYKFISPASSNERIFLASFMILTTIISITLIRQTKMVI